MLSFAKGSYLCHITIAWSIFRVDNLIRHALNAITVDIMTFWLAKYKNLRKAVSANLTWLYADLRFEIFVKNCFMWNANKNLPYQGIMNKYSVSAITC